MISEEERALIVSAIIDEVRPLDREACADKVEHMLMRLEDTANGPIARSPGKKVEQLGNVVTALKAAQQATRELDAFMCRMIFKDRTINQNGAKSPEAFLEYTDYIIAFAEASIASTTVKRTGKRINPVMELSAHFACTLLQEACRDKDINLKPKGPYLSITDLLFAASGDPNPATPLAACQKVLKTRANRPEKGAVGP
jgi:hypothetical protein